METAALEETSESIRTSIASIVGVAKAEEPEVIPLIRKLRSKFPSSYLREESISRIVKELEELSQYPDLDYSQIRETANWLYSNVASYEVQLSN